MSNMKHQPSDSLFVSERMAKGMSYDEAVAELREAEQKAIDKHGWYAHIVEAQEGDDEKNKRSFNAHTHGLVDSCNHPDFQLTMKLPPDKIISILATLCHRVRNDKLRFKDGDISDQILMNYKVKFVKRMESGRPVLRVIMPTVDGKLEQEELSGEYADQYTVET